jgi:hypothetical protein
MEIRQCLHWVAKESGPKDFIQEQSSYDDCHNVLRHGLTPYSRFCRPRWFAFVVGDCHDIQLQAKAAPEAFNAAVARRIFSMASWQLVGGAPDSNQVLEFVQTSLESCSRTSGHRQSGPERAITQPRERAPASPSRRDACRRGGRPSCLHRPQSRRAIAPE